MKKILMMAATAALLAACQSGSGSQAKTDSGAAAKVDSARTQSDSLVNNAPDTLKAK